MEFFREDQRVNSGALQVDRQSLHFSARIGEVGVADSRRNQAAAFHANFQTAQSFGGAADGIVGAVEAVQPARVVLFVEAFRAH